jgi:hypothetical protein
MSIPEPGSSWARLLGEVPLVQNMREGAWRGQLSYRRQGDVPGKWTGTIFVEGTRVPLPGFASPIEVYRARLVIKDDEATLDRFAGRLGTAEFSGEYHYRAAAARPHQFRISVDELGTAELEAQLLPVLRRDESFFTRALRLGRTRVPEWLAALRVDGILDAGVLSVGRLQLSQFRAHLRWDATTLDIPELSARYGDGTIAGHFTANLRRPLPSYRLNARFRSVNWMGGPWTGRGSLQTSGTGEELLRNLRVEGSFEGRSVALAPEVEFRTFSGTCRFAIADDLPRFQLTNLAATVGDEPFKGQGATGADGRIHFELTDGQKQMRIAMIAPFVRSGGN